MAAPPGEADFRGLMEPVARHFLGEPNRALSTRDELRWGSHGSLSVKLSTDQFYDHEAGVGGGVVKLVEHTQAWEHERTLDWLRQEYPSRFAPALPPKTNGDARHHAAPKGVIEATYPYVDEARTLLYEVVRKRDPKNFLQRRPDPQAEGGWTWSTRGLRQVPYRLPELLAAIAKGKTVFVVEGEKDVDRMRAAGFVATTNSGGVGKWRPELNPYFKGADVVVIGDHDPQVRNGKGELLWHKDGSPQLPGQDHAEDVARQLAPVARRVRLLRDLGDAWPACPSKGDVSDFFDAGKNATDLVALVAELPAYRLPANDDAGDDIETVVQAPRAISQIPPRPWAYGHFLQFGSAAVLGAPDGLGKGFVTTSIVLSVIFSRALLGERVWRSGPVAIITYEDDREEWERRIAAACLWYGLDFAVAMRNVHFIRHRTEARLVFASRDERGAVAFPDSAALVRELRACGAILLVVDPFNSAHDLDDGNSNVLIARVAQEVTRVAQATGVAALVLHHLRKGATGEADDLMGAISLRATFRNARILVRITPEQAEDLGIASAQAFRYFRIAGTKENYAPPPDKAHWFKLESQLLGNDTDDYPDGDDMAVATVWAPPSPFQGVSLPVLDRVFAKLREGLVEDGKPWCYSVETRAKFWAGDVLIEEAGISKAQAKAAVDTWVENGVAQSLPWHTPTRSRSSRIVLDEAKVAAILAPLRAATTAFDND